MSLRDELCQFIQENLAADGSVRIEADAPLIDSGIITSMGLMQLVMFLEERTGVRVPDEQVRRENFQTVASMEELVGRLRAR